MNRSERLWAAVDDYIAETLLPRDPDLERASAAAVAAALPPIAVTAPQGMLLHLIAKIHRASFILELGTLGGYSTIWLAKALPPDGRLISLEVDRRCAQTATQSVAAAGLEEIVDVRLGPALQSLEEIAAEGLPPFDLVFIDADKPTTPEYFQWALRLCRRGALIVADNVVRGGALAEERTKDLGAQGMRRFHQLLSEEPRVTATTIQTVGAKGYDGFTLALVQD